MLEPQSLVGGQKIIDSRLSKTWMKIANERRRWSRRVYLIGIGEMRWPCYDGHWREAEKIRSFEEERSLGGRDRRLEKGWYASYTCLFEVEPTSDVAAASFFNLYFFYQLLVSLTMSSTITYWLKFKRFYTHIWGSNPRLFNFLQIIENSDFKSRK